MNSWLLKPFEASINPIGTRCFAQMLSKIQFSKVILDKSGWTLFRPCKVHTSFSKALHSIVDSAVKDARWLRNTFRRSNANRLAEDILNVAFKSQMLR